MCVCVSGEPQGATAAWLQGHRGVPRSHEGRQRVLQNESWEPSEAALQREKIAQGDR